MEKYNTFWRRVVASIIDGLILYPFFYIEGIINNSSNILFISIGSLTFAVIYTLYYVILHAKYGHTLGKKIMNIKVMDINEVQLIGYKRAALRELPWIITTFLALTYMFWLFYTLKNPNIQGILEKYNDINSLIAFFWIALELITMLTNFKKRAIHDWFANSVVIRHNK